MDECPSKDVEGQDGCVHYQRARAEAAEADVERLASPAQKLRDADKALADSECTGSARFWVLMCKTANETALDAALAEHDNQLKREVEVT